MLHHASPQPLPDALTADRGPVLRGVLRELPSELLMPLLQGLRRYADSLVAGRLATRDGGCAVGVMLRELGSATEPPTRMGRIRRDLARRFGTSIYDHDPAMAAAHPRLHHIEIVFDVTCRHLAELEDRELLDIPRAVGIWMAAAVQGEINLRHVQRAAAGAPPPRSAELDPELFADTVGRLRALRPELSVREAVAAVESLVGARRRETDPLFVPDTWRREVELHEQRTDATATLA